MRRLPVLLVALALPALAQESADAGTPAPVHQGVGRHFAWIWDMVGPEQGQSDVQLWATPRWGRASESFTAVDVRAGVVMGLRRGYGLGFFVDARPEAHGPNAEPSFDGRATVHLQDRGRFAPGVHWGSQAELSIGLHGAALWLMLGADAQLGAMRLALNLDAWTDAVWYPTELPGGGGGTLWLDTSRVRQMFGFSYALPNGFSIGVELQNRLSWRRSTYVGDAFLVGPTVSFRGEQVWVTVALLPQVAAVKIAEKKGGDPLELTDNERFTMRIALGLLAR